MARQAAEGAAPSDVCCSCQLLPHDRLSQNTGANTPVVGLLAVLQRGLGPAGQVGRADLEATIWHSSEFDGAAQSEAALLSHLNLDHCCLAAGGPVLLGMASQAGQPRLLWGPGAKESSPSMHDVHLRLFHWSRPAMWPGPKAKG